MRWPQIVMIGVVTVLGIGVLGVAISSGRDRAAIQPVLHRMVALENPLVLSPQILSLGNIPSPTMKRQLWNAESKVLASTFAPGSPLIARDRHIYRVTMATIQDKAIRITYDRIHVSLQSVVAVGPWARAAWRAKVDFSSGAHHAAPVLNGEVGVAYLHRVQGQWRVTTYSEHYIPGEGP